MGGCCDLVNAFTSRLYYVHLQGLEEGVWSIGG